MNERQGLHETLFPLFQEYFDTVLSSENIERQGEVGTEIDSEPTVLETSEPQSEPASDSASEIDVFDEKIAPAITKVPSAAEIGAEYSALSKMFPQHVSEQNYAKAKGISQVYLRRCINQFENQ
ncbi:hypothetical protein [Candidatus Enterococcus willemsii]|uniref:Uncharacterized protein n=1 Tax=Candidatus Enterococcus willemsii TaxID=1857215 RepID=A0ABQ6YWW3_9ENTE|nr:hypothetical protein [Enterococcus sp. CU12B]KAF1302196.1 hypothetical protein BAU17_02135 [Enterococcus sp. CU12B]